METLEKEKFRSLATSETSKTQDFEEYFTNPTLDTKLSHAEYQPLGYGVPFTSLGFANSDGGKPQNDEARIAGSLIYGYVRAAMREDIKTQEEAISQILRKYGNKEWIIKCSQNLAIAGVLSRDIFNLKELTN